MATTRITVLIVAGLVILTKVNLRRSEPLREASAIGSLRAIASAQVSYASMNGGYAASLKALATACPRMSQGFVSPDLAHDPTIKNGYEIRVRTEGAARP